MGLFSFLKKEKEPMYVPREVEYSPIVTSWGYEFPEDYEFYPNPTDLRSYEELVKDLKNLMLKHFRECRIYHQVPASALDPHCHPACEPIPFLLEKDRKYKLAVFVVNDLNYRSRKITGTQEILDSMGITHINFREEYANDDDYVVARIRYYLEH